MVFTVEPVRLAGQHVVLEPICEAHSDGLFSIGQEKADWAYMPTPAFSVREDAQKWVRQALELRDSGTHVTFVLLHAGSGEIMGSTRYLNIRPRDRGLEIGYTWLGKAHQRTRTNTEAKYLLLQHAFETLGTHRVELKTDLRNSRSQKAIERIGAQREGVLRRHMVTQGGYVRDSVMFSITDLDWPQAKTRLQTMLK